MGCSWAKEKAIKLAAIVPDPTSASSMSDASLMHLTEHRGMTLSQFRDLRDELKRRADKDGWLQGWVDRKGNTLHVNTVDLYAVRKYLIKPATEQKQCSYVEQVAPAGTRAQTPKWFVTHWWLSLIHI